jgi:hypothetical protein
LKVKREQLSKEAKVKEKEQAAIRVKALRNTLSTAVVQEELPEDEDESASSSHEYEIDSEAECSLRDRERRFPTSHL